MEAGDAITVGASPESDGEGRAIPANGALRFTDGEPVTPKFASKEVLLFGADLPEFVFADALHPAAGPGELIKVLLRR